MNAINDRCVIPRTGIDPQGLSPLTLDVLLTILTLSLVVSGIPVVIQYSVHILLSDFLLRLVVDTGL